MRKLLSLFFLLLLAAGVWFGARWVAHRGEVKATIVFDDAGSLRDGDPVVEGEEVVGRVVEIARVNDRDAVTVRLDRAHPRAIVTDSLFSAERHRLVVTNTIAVGKPIEDGAIIYAKEDRISRWLARHGASVAPALSKLKKKADEQLDAAKQTSWREKVKAWWREASK